jgi:hypothetical protein
MKGFDFGQHLGIEIAALFGDREHVPPPSSEMRACSISGRSAAMNSSALRRKIGDRFVGSWKASSSTITRSRRNGNDLESSSTHAHRAAGVAAPCKVAGAGGDGRGRAARRGARQTPGRARIDRRAVLRIRAGRRCSGTLDWRCPNRAGGRGSDKWHRSLPLRPVPVENLCAVPGDDAVMRQEFGKRALHMADAMRYAGQIGMAGDRHNLRPLRGFGI